MAARVLGVTRWLRYLRTSVVWICELVGSGLAFWDCLIRSTVGLSWTSGEMKIQAPCTPQWLSLKACDQDWLVRRAVICHGSVQSRVIWVSSSWSSSSDFKELDLVDSSAAERLLLVVALHCLMSSTKLRSSSIQKKPEIVGVIENTHLSTSADISPLAAPGSRPNSQQWPLSSGTHNRRTELLPGVSLASFPMHLELLFLVVHLCCGGCGALECNGTKVPNRLKGRSCRGGPSSVGLLGMWLAWSMRRALVFVWQVFKDKSFADAWSAWSGRIWKYWTASGGDNKAIDTGEYAMVPYGIARGLAGRGKLCYIKSLSSKRVSRNSVWLMLVLPRASKEESQCIFPIAATTANDWMTSASRAAK